jgi:hypothetical protein
MQQRGGGGPHPHLRTMEWSLVPSVMPHTSKQGLTLVHFSAQRKLFVWDRGWN